MFAAFNMVSTITLFYFNFGLCFHLVYVFILNSYFKSYHCGHLVSRATVFNFKFGFCLHLAFVCVAFPLPGHLHNLDACFSDAAGYYG